MTTIDMSDSDGDDSSHQEEAHGGDIGPGRRASDGRKIVDFAENGQAIGEWAEEFKTFLGKTVRDRVDINIQGWKTVENRLKMQMWKEIQDAYVVDDKMYNVIFKRLGKVHRDFRSRLRTGFLNKTRPVGHDSGEAFEKYKGIVTKDAWEEFCAKAMTPEFMDKVQEEISAGAWKPHGRHDILSEVLEKPDYPGRVRGVGGGVGFKQVFDREPRNSRKVGGLSEADLRNLKEELMKDVEKAFIQRGFHSTTFESMPSQEVYADTMNSTAPVPQKHFSDRTSCKLAIEKQTPDGQKDVEYMAIANLQWLIIARQEP
ncbi:unnamed protein product [Cuscuta epithymum]|uniref:Myb/SANT-like domain-containing protein n=2 Tax=Cuscuta epithymum TaxID=186058 RepID=A0AAV0EQL3_9ASTE|nr:unnamed protein product [Cuscuta epithymum]